MKKIEILNLIEANEIINQNNKLLSIIKDKELNQEYWFPNIEELKEEFNILKEEVEEALLEKTKCRELIQNSNCNHEVRLEHYGLFCSHYKCIFCGKSIIGNNCVNWEYSINRNKYCVSLVSKYQDDEDYGYISKGYSLEQVYEIIKNILKNKKDDEEVDLIQEFKKLNLTNCTVNEDKKVSENYILIISGSNKQFIDNESYIHKKGLTIGLDFVQSFSCLLNTKVELIDNIEISEKENFKTYFPKEEHNLKFTCYDTINKLEKIISEQKEIPFKIIIDISELYEYKTDNNVISKQQYKLNLNEYFPNSHIIRIDNLSNKSIKELSMYLTNLQSYDNLHAYQNNRYYYIDNNEIKYNDLENTFIKIKKLLRK